MKLGRPCGLKPSAFRRRLGGSQATIEATVLDRDSNPVVSAAVKGIGHLPPREPSAFEPGIVGQSTTLFGGTERILNQHNEVRDSTR